MILILIVCTKKNNTFNLVALYSHIHLTLVHIHFFPLKSLNIFFTSVIRLYFFIISFSQVMLTSFYVFGIYFDICCHIYDVLEKIHKLN